jgi:dephospho-CoA kinase
MQIVGLIGGVASGKSLVAWQLGELGAAVLDADRAGHEVLRDKEVEREARNRWGDEIFATDGHIDRPRLARIVFAPTDAGRRELAYLEQLTHPRIRERLHRELAELASAGQTVAVLDAPVMLKAGWTGFCDRMVFVDAPRETRLKRAAERGWSEEQLIQREAAQESIEVKRRSADTVIDNSGTPEQTLAQVVQFWKSLRT